MSKINKEEIHKIFIGMKNGSELEFNNLYEKYNDLVYKISFSILKNKEDSEEVTQTTFMKIFELDKEKLPKDNETSWIYKVTKNNAISLLRQRKANICIDEIYNIEDCNNEIDDIVNKIEFNQLISRLKDEDREIISLRILSDLSFSQISKLLNKPLGTIKWKYYKAVNTLKILLGNLTMFIVTLIIGLKTINIKDKNKESEIKYEENIKENIKEETKKELDITDGVKEEAKKDEIQSEDTEKDINKVKQETVVTDNEQVNNYNSYFGIGVIGISAIFFVLTIMFSIFLVKYSPKHKGKASK